MRSYQKKDLIKLCARLTAKLLRTAYKSKIIDVKLDEDLLQRWIYFLTFVESLEMIFPQYKETCEVLLDYSKIGGENIKDVLNIPLELFLIPTLMYITENLLISSQEMEWNVLETFSHIVSTWILLTKVDMIELFNKLHINDRSIQWTKLKYSKMHRFCQFL